MKKKQQMKSKYNFKNIIGLTQEEAAMYFGVTEGHWSMFAIGKRDLPLEGTIKLGALLQYVKEKKPVSEARQQLDKAENEKLLQKLQQDSTDIRFKIYKLAKKISTIENIRTECFAALEVAEFIGNQEEKHPIGSLSNFIRFRATKTLKQHDLYSLTELQIKKESLEILKTTLEKKIKAIQK